MALPSITSAAARPLLLFALLLACLHLTWAYRDEAYNLYWNTKNDIFHINNTNRVFNLNEGNSQFEFVDFNLICSCKSCVNSHVYLPEQIDEENEKYIIYNVSKKEYDTCHITNPNSTIVAKCIPKKNMRTVYIFGFSSDSIGRVLQQGQTYYFISTSSKEDLFGRTGGWCSSHNMKFAFRMFLRSSPPTTTAVATMMPTSKPLFSNEIPKLDNPINDKLENEELSFSRGSSQSSLLPLLVPVLTAAALPTLLLSAW